MSTHFLHYKKTAVYLNNFFERILRIVDCDQVANFRLAVGNVLYHSVEQLMKNIN